jgi:glutamine amidotransferase
MSNQVVVVDYGMGNVFSVCNALYKIGASPILSGNHDVIANAERVILPGVGAFAKAMEGINRRRLLDPISNFINTGRPILGICVGMQMFMERSLEFGDEIGLGFIKGSVERLPNKSKMGDAIKIPHIGWGQINVHQDHAYLRSIENKKKSSYFYFVHSFYCKPHFECNVIASVNCQNEPITAMIRKDNITGVQFHPEKSGLDGLNFLSNFVFAS